MLTVLAGHWGMLMLRAVTAILFGLLALMWPGLTLAALIILFGAYALVDGIAALIMAIASRGLPGFGSLLVQGLIGVAAGVFTFLYPGLTAIALLVVIAAWAVVIGIGAIAAAIALRKEMTGEWPLPFVGALSIVLGLLLMLRPGEGALALVWLIALYALLAGATQLVLALRMRQLAHEMVHA
jgi:uncharacterized membrane protein HdeD (DUF308 family)